MRCWHSLWFHAFYLIELYTWYSPRLLKVKLNEPKMTRKHKSREYQYVYNLSVISDCTSRCDVELWSAQYFVRHLSYDYHLVHYTHYPVVLYLIHHRGWSSAGGTIRPVQNKTLPWPDVGGWCRIPLHKTDFLQGMLHNQQSHPDVCSLFHGRRNLDGEMHIRLYSHQQVLLK